MPRIEQNGDVVPSHGRKVSNPLRKGKHLTEINDDDEGNGLLIKQKQQTGDSVNLLFYLFSKI